MDNRYAEAKIRTLEERIWCVERKIEEQEKAINLVKSALKLLQQQSNNETKVFSEKS